ncbi:transglycosylase SLT domain-containing protein [Ascidiimonas sp. W6]|uniref:transglycosylase SLT domain-containing protein n=1 Tax=Ascidiimonas meishanensis TaxID=3128903 RepID=UPI0030EF1E64
MKKIFPLFFTLILIFYACKKRNTGEVTDADAQQISIDRDLEVIQKNGKLKALIINSSTSYFLYKGKPMGYEYELLKRLAKDLSLELEITVSNNLDSIFKQLRRGDVDIIAHGLAVTADRKKLVHFTDYLYLTHQVLVQKKPDNWRSMGWASLQKSIIKDAIELIGETISVRQKSSYFKRIENLSKEIGGNIYIDTLKGNYSTDRIIEMVANGKIKYTVADANLAKINASYKPILDIEVPISFSQRAAWAVRPNAPKLLKAVNEWVTKERKTLDYYVIYNKYFKNKRNFRKRIKSEFYSLNNNQISAYDETIKKHAEEIGWDWRLLASLIYQESQFDAQASSWVGAGGLMQLMPATAAELGVTNLYNPMENIRAGTSYLQQIYEDFEGVTDSIQRIKFTLASYNCGYYHVLDAQRLAELKGFDKNQWDAHVEKMILELSYPENYKKEIVKYGYVRGSEPHTYVRQIFQRYDHYQNFIDP